jgi:WD40 repeat protein
MFRFIPLLVVFTLFFSGCSNMMQADKAVAVFSQAHDSGATAVAFSPDSRWLISGGHKGDVKIWDVRTKSALAEIPAHKGVVSTLLFLTNNIFVSGAEDGKLILWENARIKNIRELSPILGLVALRGQLVSAQNDGWLRIWDSNLGERASLKLDQEIVTISSHRNTLAIGTTNQIPIMNDSLKVLRTLNIESGRPHDLQFSPDGRTLAAGNWFNLVTWDLATGRQESHPTEHNGLLASVSYSPDGQHIVSLGRHTDSAIRIMDTHNFMVERRYQAHEMCGAMIRYSPDGRWMASVSDDESVRLYDLAKPYTANSALSSY